jgi:aminoglycoside phosphotransferase (APT) family kinase protein
MLIEDAGVTPSEAAVRAVVTEWMDAQHEGEGPLSDFEPLTGGTQNVMVAFARGDRRYVLRRGPENPRPRSNDNLLREVRMLTALRSTGVPHARLITSCSDPSVLGGSVFYVMERVDGFNPAASLPPAYAGDFGMSYELGLAVVDALAELGDLVPEQVGLGDFGKPAGFLKRQVPRWLTELESYDRFHGYVRAGLDDVDEVARWLDAHRPALWWPGILHGDYQLSNVLISPLEPRVAAIVDWEMATIGDPLLDLGWLLASWPLPGTRADTLGTAYARGGAFPTESELVSRYAVRSQRDLSSIGWYAVLACFKIGIVLEGTHARACAGKAPRDTGDRLHAIAVGLLEQAGDRIAKA